MTLGLIILLLQIGEAPLLWLIDDLVWQGVIALQTAIGLAAVSWKIPPGEGKHWWGLSWVPVLCGLFPAVWMIVQTIPLPFEAGSNFIAKSASAALGARLLGSISIDTGATLIALGRYLTAIAMAVLAAAVTIDRWRAGRVLPAVTAAATVMAVAKIGFSIWGAAAASTPSSAQMGVLASASGLGVILAAGCLWQHVEQRAARANDSTSRARGAILAGYGGAFAICVAAISAAPGELFSAGGGLVVVLILMLVRRFALRKWEIALLVFACAISAAILALYAAPQSSELSLRFTTTAAGDAVTTTERMISDSPWTGTGAGTFAALLNIYRDPNQNADLGPATSAALLVIEMGRPVFIVILLIALAWIGLLCRGAVARGRDASYAAVAAGTAVTLTLGMFQSASLVHSTILILAAVIGGLGMAQRVGRSVR